MSTFTIDEAHFQDLLQLSQLLNELFTIEKDFAPNPERQQQGLKLLLEHPEFTHLLVARNVRNVAIGMCSVQLVISTAQGGYAAWVEDLIVIKDFQQQGVAKALLQAAMRWAGEHGVTRLQLLVDMENHAALEFYQHLGWKNTQLQARHYFLTNE
ncbi:MAG: GNAT family N-acetyltransferase [Thiotrichaceae bacterium]|nr:GNAT family N-acetyltransferase [Thiotrichaceae bacterium]